MWIALWVLHLAWMSQDSVNNKWRKPRLFVGYKDTFCNWYLIEKSKQNIIELVTRTWRLQQNLARPAAPSWDLWRTAKPAKRLLPQNFLTRPPVKTAPFPSLKPPSNPSGETTNRLNMCFSQVSFYLLSFPSIRFCKIKGSKKFYRLKCINFIRLLQDM